MDLDDDELRATREKLGIMKKYIISFKDGDKKYYVKDILIDEKPPISIVPGFSKEEGSIFDIKDARKTVEILKEVNKETNLTFDVEEV